MFGLVIIVFGLFFVTMAIGVLLGGKPLAGSCGGLAQAGLDGDCKICGRTPGSCESEGASSQGSADESPSGKAAAAMAVDAMASVQKEDVRVTLQRNKSRSHPDPLDF